ncbi:hypothetical protein [Paenibacillus sp. USDA918EY]|uniref:hypothetical protein n=1 Tax=Paenibacillus sp. USDA918EY TaxID=2689575 RepID=UPI001356F395|nr:hypothetical protein [Paenibacillus sp. USDA918EY]
MTKEKRKMTVILLRLARELNAQQNKLVKNDEDYDYFLMKHINMTIYAISEVHSIASLDPIDTEILRTVWDYLERKINMRQCLEGISLHLAELDDGR